MVRKIETVVKITRDGIMEIPVEELVAGDEVRVTLVIEEMVSDGEMEDLVAAYQKAKREIAASGEAPLPFEAVHAGLPKQRKAA